VSSFVPDDFTVPTELDGPGFRLEPLGPEHNERDYAAWTSSLDHIRVTPGFPWNGWPSPMPLEENLGDLEMHARHFEERVGFTYSVLDGDEVIGCVYIYPTDDADAHVRSWVSADRADLDVPLWQSMTEWLATDWPFDSVDYAPRST
jgi:RimJ/RimL family protein N-acetyltransferase